MSFKNKTILLLKKTCTDILPVLLHPLGCLASQSYSHWLLPRSLNQLLTLNMQGQIPCSACWLCSPGSSGTRPVTTFEDAAERQSPSASARGWQPHSFFSLQSQWRGAAAGSEKEGGNQRWGSSSLRFLVLFIHHYKVLGVYCCCEHWIMLSMYVWCAMVCSSSPNNFPTPANLL